MMAAGGAAALGGCEAPIRLRLLFDYPPPRNPACGLCWLLVEPRQVRLVTDVASLIQEKFGFSRRAKLSLFLDGALLPPTESARLVRDNDSLRVKLEAIVGRGNYSEITNSFNNPSKKERKFHKQNLETENSESDDGNDRKKRKSKCNFEHCSSQEESIPNVQISKKKKKKKKEITGKSCITNTQSDVSTSPSKNFTKRSNLEVKETENKDKEKQKAKTCDVKKTLPKAAKAFPFTATQKSTARNVTALSSSQKVGSSSSSDSEHSLAELNQKLSNKMKVASQQIYKPQRSDSPVKSSSFSKFATKSKDGTYPKTIRELGPLVSSSLDSAKREQLSSNPKSKLPYNSQGNVKTLYKLNTSSESDQSGSESFTVKKPKTNALAIQYCGEKIGSQQLATNNCLTTNPIGFQRGYGRGEYCWRGPRIRGYHGAIGGRGKGRGNHGSFMDNCSGEGQKQQQLNEAAMNTSVIQQKPLDAPKKDYSKLPLLAAPPQVGEKIAFKLLELSANYTPEVSDYKEGKIISWDATDKKLEVEFTSFSSVAKEPGKFDLVYQSEDGAARVEYAVPQDRMITKSWDSLIEPRLIIDLPSTMSNIENSNP